MQAAFFSGVKTRRWSPPACFAFLSFWPLMAVDDPVVVVQVLSTYKPFASKASTPFLFVFIFSLFWKSPGNFVLIFSCDSFSIFRAWWDWAATDGQKWLCDAVRASKMTIEKLQYFQIINPPQFLYVRRDIEFYQKWYNGHVKKVATWFVTKSGHSQIYFVENQA